MLIALAVLLAVAWLLGFTVFHVASAAIHVLIALAIVALIVHFVQGRGTMAGAGRAPRADGTGCFARHVDSVANGSDRNGEGRYRFGPLAHT